MAPWQVWRMDGILRWTIAIVAAAMLFSSSMAVAGVQEAQSQSERPAWYETAAPLPGDEALYKTALVVVDEDRGEYIDMHARFAFERLPDGLMLHDGALVPVERVVSEWRTEPFEFDVATAIRMPPELMAPVVPTIDYNACYGSMGYGSGYGDPDAMEQWGEEFEACMENWAQEFEQSMDEFARAMEEFSRSMGDLGHSFERWGDDFDYYSGAWQESLTAGTHRVAAQGWHVTHRGAVDAVSVRPDDPSLLDPRPGQPLTDAMAGLPTAFEAMLDLPVVTVPDDSTAPCGWKTSMQGQRIDLRDGVVVHGQCPPDMFLGFADVVPLPGPLTLHVTGQDTVNGNDTIVLGPKGAEEDLRLWFTETVPYPVRVLSKTDAVPPPVQEMLGGDYQEPAFYVLHELVRFVAGSPVDAPAPQPAGDLTGNAGFWGPDTRGIQHPWPVREALEISTANNGTCGALRSWLALHPTADVVHSAQVDDGWLLHLEDDGQGMWTHIAKPGLCRQTGTMVLQALGPGPMPTLQHGDALLARWTGTHMTRYGHDAVDDRILTVGNGRYLLSVDEQGRMHALASDDDQPEPRFSDPAWDPDAEGDWHVMSHDSGAWSMPDRATATTIAAGSVAAGAMVLLWPALKGLLGGIGLFSRIRREDLLEHPVRAGIMETIESDPGVHFQELVRRMGKGRGTMEHHVRKLVQSGLLVEKAERGFTCYFPKGAVDRRLMEMAPLFKAQGARRVLQAVQAQPGAATMELASTLGMATSTVNYHVKRLVDAGVLDSRRDGRFVRLDLTDLGGEALGRFGRT